MNRPHQLPDGSWIDLGRQRLADMSWNDALDYVQKMDERLSALEKKAPATPEPLAWPKIDPDRLAESWLGGV